MRKASASAWISRKNTPLLSQGCHLPTVESHSFNNHHKTRNDSSSQEPFLPQKAKRTERGYVRTDRRQMSFFWSGDSASLDRVGDWAVGDLQTFFFSSTPFSASELEKREKRFTLAIQRWVDRKTMKSPRFLESGMIFSPHQQAEVNLDSCALPEAPF